MAVLAPAPVARRAPLVVFLGGYLLAGLAAIRVAFAIGTFFAVPEVSRHYGELHGDPGAGAGAAAGVVVYGVFSLLVAAVCLVLAILDGRGSNPARIVTWVVGGLVLCLNLPSLVTSLYDVVPWYRRLSLIVAVATMVLAAAVVVLLALPAANAYFRGTRRPRQPFGYPPGQPLPYPPRQPPYPQQQPQYPQQPPL